MENMLSPASSDKRGISTIEIFGRQVKVKNYICSADGKSYPLKPGKTKLQLSVLPQSYCPASCPFCIASGTNRHDRVDLKKLESVMRLLKKEELVRGVKITGGEPFYDFDLLRETIDLLFDVFGTGLELSVSTNGMDLERITELKNLRYIETFHISRHHYDDEINRRLFGGAAVPDGARLREIISQISFKDIFVFNCMLLKDYIGTPDEARRFLDFAIDIGVPKVGFMCCSGVNKFAIEQFTRFESVLKDGDPSLLFTRGFYDYDICHCRDGVYVSSDGRLIEFYGRDTVFCDPGYSRGLVYDSDNYLKDGFSGQILF